MTEEQHMKEVWQKLLELTLRQSGELDSFLASVQQTVSEQEFGELKVAVGKVMGEYYFSVIEPVCAQFPELKPSFLRGNAPEQ
jgi:transcription elongation factor GreA-like protein